jgi:hypothetical protein
VTKALNAAIAWLDEKKDTTAQLEIHELTEDIKLFEAKLEELRAKIDPIMGKLYGGDSRRGGNDDDADLHEEL